MATSDSQLFNSVFGLLKTFTDWLRDLNEIYAGGFYTQLWGTLLVAGEDGSAGFQTEEMIRTPQVAAQ